MYAVLMVKTEEVLRIRNASRDGMQSYMRLNKWFTETSGRGLADRKRAVMRPTEVKREEEISRPLKHGKKNFEIFAKLQEKMLLARC